MKFSIVTPSYNQAPFLEAAMSSVLSQRDAELEYVVMDRGSTDGSPAIIERHAAQLAYWESARDAGQYDAITRGFAKTSGEILAWLNSDDLYCPGAFSIAREILCRRPGSMACWSPSS